MVLHSEETAAELLWKILGYLMQLEAKVRDEDVDNVLEARRLVVLVLRRYEPPTLQKK